MENTIKKAKYKGTLFACYAALVTQAICNNFTALLFLTFSSTYGLSLTDLSSLIAVNFCVQICVDFITPFVVNKIGYKAGVVASQLLSALGLVGLALLPEILPSPYIGLMISIIIYAIGGGMCEVLVSPIVESCPTENKAAHQGLLHSFYCWGHVFMILVSTAFFALFGIENWRIMAIIWTIVPISSIVLFIISPMYHPDDIGGTALFSSIGKLAKTPLFWVMFLFMMLSGASELGMSQWVSSFAEAGLNVSKTTGDLIGTCMFGVCMGSARTLLSKLSGKITTEGFMLFSAALCVSCYLCAALSQNAIVALIACALCGFSVGVMWPGSLSIASARIPFGGTALFSFLALAGDLGCTLGPNIVGRVAAAFGNDLKIGLLSAAVIPALLLISLLVFFAHEKRTKKAEI